jgi:hypothetical protein
MVTLGEDDRALGQAWHVPNAPGITLRQFVQLVCAEAGVAPRISAFPRGMVRLLLPLMGLFVPSLRGLHENIYIGYEPYIVDHSKTPRRLAITRRRCRTRLARRCAGIRHRQPSSRIGTPRLTPPSFRKTMALTTRCDR